MFLRGDREYVQGTQITARASEMLPEGDWSLVGAKFSKITKHLIDFICDETADGEVGVIQFKDAAGALSNVYAIEGTEVAPRRDEPMPVKVTPDPDTAPDGAMAYAFTNASTFEDLLNVFVIALKAEHERRFAGAKDIWFTGLRGGNLSTAPALPSGHVILQMMRQMEGDTAYQTLWRCTLQDAAGTTIAQPAITFSYVPGTS